jgi:Tfp pilus assembly protein PilV
MYPALGDLRVESMNNKGMSLVEAVVAVALMFLISGALVSFTVSSLSAVTASQIRARATRLAEQRMEIVKQAEQANKGAIQSNTWTAIDNLNVVESPSPEFTFGTSGNNFFTRRTAVSPITDGRTIVVTVSWTYKGVGPNCTVGQLKNCVMVQTTLTRWL